MLGLAPVSARAISGGPFALVAVPALAVAAITVTFDLDGRVGAVTPISSSIAVTFEGSSTLFVRQAISGVASITFGGDPSLRVAGKPFIVSAIPVSFTARVIGESYTVTAAHERFTTRGVR